MKKREIKRLVLKKETVLNLQNVMGRGLTYENNTGGEGCLDATPDTNLGCAQTDHTC